MSEQVDRKVYPEFQQFILDDGRLLWLSKTRRDYIAVGCCTVASDGSAIPLPDDEVLDVIYKLQGWVR